MNWVYEVEDDDPEFDCCFFGQGDQVARFFVDDPRVDLNEMPTGDGSSPLCEAVARSRLEIIKLWIASGRFMSYGTPGEWVTDPLLRAAEQLKEKKRGKRGSHPVPFGEIRKGPGADEA